MAAKGKRKNRSRLAILLIIGVVAFVFRQEIVIAYKFVESKYLGGKVDFADFKIHGLDVSEYQGKIDWDGLGKLNGRFKPQFVFIRSTCGDDKLDNNFAVNWKGALRSGLIRGVYHYYRPNENSFRQAQNFIDNVTLEAGDLPPVCDIEEISTIQSMDSLRLGLTRFLGAIEEHYKVKPIIYCGESFYRKHLQSEFSDYPFWISLFSEKREPLFASGWTFWQYTETGKVYGIKGFVDFNVYMGDMESLNKLCIK